VLGQSNAGLTAGPAADAVLRPEETFLDLEDSKKKPGEARSSEGDASA
jgi:hypothetical protein